MCLCTLLISDEYAETFIIYIWTKSLWGEWFPWIWRTRITSYRHFGGLVSPPYLHIVIVQYCWISKRTAIKLFLIYPSLLLVLAKYFFIIITLHCVLFIFNFISGYFRKRMIMKYLTSILQFDVNDMKAFIYKEVILHKNNITI